MNCIRFTIGSALLLAVFATASLAGTAPRTWVSGNGSDLNACTFAAPCRNFNAAIAQTASGGEVVAMDSACYQPFSINQGITIEAAPGVYAGITASAGNGVNITAGSQDIVVLSGLTIQGQNSGAAGINFVSGGTLAVENCSVFGFSTGNGNGISFFGNGTLLVKNSVLRSNCIGIDVEPASNGASAVALIDGVQIEGTGPPQVAYIGLCAGDGSKVTVRNSVVNGYGFGFFAFSQSPLAAELNLDYCAAINNVSGVEADSDPDSASATVRISNSTVTDNTTGLTAYGASAVILSSITNTVAGNASGDTIGNISTYVLK
jgi:hypothetical protein